MRINLRNTILAPAVLAVASFTAVSAHAEATFKVPFSFKAAGKNLPAGDYVVSKDAKSHAITLRGKEDGRSFTWLAGPGAVDANKATLRFDATGSTHELRSVQYGTMTTSQLDKTKHNERVPVETIAGQ